MESQDEDLNHGYLTFNFLTDEERLQPAPIESRDPNCLHVSVNLLQPPFSMFIAFMDDLINNRRVVAGPIPYMVRQLMRRANISCVQEVGSQTYADFYDNLVRFQADLAVGSSHLYPTDLRHVILGTPQFVYDDAIVGREVLRHVDTSTDVMHFYSLTEAIILLIVLIACSSFVSLIRRCHCLLTQNFTDRLTVFVCVTFELICTHFAHQSVDFSIKFNHRRTSRMKLKVRCLLDLWLHLVWIWFSWFTYTVASNQLLGLLMSPLVSDRYNSLLDIIGRNSSGMNCIYWPGAGLDQLLQETSLVSGTLIESEKAFDSDHVIRQILDFQAIVVNTVETARALVMAVVGFNQDVSDGIYYTVDRNSITAPLGFVPLTRFCRPEWRKVFSWINSQYAESGIFSHETDATREEMALYMGASLGPLHAIDHRADLILAGKADDASSYSSLDTHHLGLFFVLIVSIQSLTFVIYLIWKAADFYKRPVLV